MDKYEYNLKLEEINKLVESGNYEDAAVIADTIDWKRVRNARTLCMVSEIYEANDRMENSKAVLMRAYRRSQIGRMILYRLTEVAIKMGEFDEAIEYYSEFVDNAPNDNSRYILKYKIYKGRGSSISDQISILEDYKEKEYTEKWAYELANLYYKAGEDQKCIEECDDLVLWFHQGNYVVKALELKSKLTSLSPQQQAIYDHRHEHIPNKAELVEAAVPELEKIITETMPTSQEEAIADNIISETQRELAQAVTQHAAEAQAEKGVQDESWRYHTGPEASVPLSNTKQIDGEAAAVQPEAPAFNVEDLQRELANSMREIVSGMTRKESDEGIIEPMNDKPFHEEIVQEKPEENPDNSVEEAKPQMNIDDVLTAMAAGTGTAGQTVEQVSAATVEQVSQGEAGQQKDQPQIEETKDQPQVIEERKDQQADQPAQDQPAQSQEQKKNVPTGDTIDLSAALERAAGVENMRPNPESKAQPVQEEPKKEEVSHTIPQLTPDEQYIFSYFSSIQGLREQIAMALQDAKRKVKLDRTSRSGNIVITGMPGSGRTTLAIRLAKALSRYKGESSARIAKIYAEDFNKKDIPKTVAKIAGGTLIIEEAGDLEDGVVQQLAKAMEFRTDGLIIILEDEKHLLKALFDKHPELAEKFTSEVTVPIFTNDELVAFGKTYAFDEDYKIEDMATMALYNRIGELQTPEHPVTVLDVKDIVDQAIKRSERFGIRKLGMILSKKRYDEDDRIILYEKDFK